MRLTNAHSELHSFLFFVFYCHCAIGTKVHLILYSAICFAQRIAQEDGISTIGSDIIQSNGLHLFKVVYSCFNEIYMSGRYGALFIVNGY